jgi:hypothetical protein
MEVTERRWSMSDITKCMDEPLAKARQQVDTDRALTLLVQGVIDALKALPDTGPAGEINGRAYHTRDGVVVWDDELASPND